MRQHRSRFRGAPGLAWLLGMALACSDDPNCGQTNSCALFEEALENSLNDSEGPCSSLSETACRRSSSCIMDSICVAQGCNGSGCSGPCELVRSCVPN